MIPELEKLGCKTMLYVGWRADCKPWWHDYMAERLGKDRVDVLEVFGGNVADMEREIWAGRYRVSQVIHGDARYDGVIPYDVIFWDHGPEHVTYDDLKVATKNLLESASKALVYCCPWGDWPQGPEGGNVHEIHANSVTPEQLIGLGMNVVTFGQSGQQNEGELVAWIYR